MPPVLLAILIIGFFAGVMLLWLGLHGRRVNDHPTCRQCRFDLEGVYPEAVTCPECGAGLKREGSTRMGVRKRLPALVAAGTLLVILPAAPLAAIGYAALTGTDINGLLPVGVLLWEAKHATPASSEKIANEFIRRAQGKKLSPAQYTRVIAQAIAMQKDPSAPWGEAWGSFIEGAKLDGTLSSVGWDTYEKQSALFKVSNRPRTAAGATLPISIKLDQARVSPSDAVVHTLSLVGATVDGKKVDARVARSDRAGIFHMVGGGLTILNGGTLAGGLGDESPDVLGTVMAAGSRVPLGVFGSGSNLAPAEVRLPADLAPGKHTVQIELTQETSSGGRLGFGMPTIAGDTATPLVLTTEVEVAPVDQLISAVEPTPEVTGKLARALRPQAIMLSRDEASPGGAPSVTAQVTIPVANLPAPIACDVMLRRGNHEWKIGELNSGAPASKAASRMVQSSFSYTVTINGVTRTSRTSSGDDERTVEGSVPGFDGDAADVVLRPRAEAALSSTDQTKFYDGEIVIPDVPVQRFENDDPFRDLREMQKRQDALFRQFQNRARGGR